MPYTSIGQPATRIEGQEKVTGATRYTVDVTLPGLLWGRALRSTVLAWRVAVGMNHQAKPVAGLYK